MPRQAQKKGGKGRSTTTRSKKSLSSGGKVARESVNELIGSLQQWLNNEQPSGPFADLEDFWSIISPKDSSTSNSTSRTTSLLRSIVESAPPEEHSIRTLPELPTEILTAIIVDACFGSSDSQECSISISHVCRRLRNIALSTPQIWTHVSNYQCLEKLTNFLDRSKQEGLSIELISMRDDDSECAPFLEQIVPHANRWKEFRFVADEFRRDFFLELKKIWKATRVQLPALETLHLHCYSPKYGNEVDEEIEAWGVLYFWKAWTMPNLRNVYISMVAEDVVQDCSAFGTELTTLRADYRNVHWEDYDLMNYMTFLSNFRALRTLELAFYDLNESYYGLGYSDSVFPGCRQLQLPNLESLQLHFTPKAFHVVDGAINIFDDLMKALHIPRLSQLALRVDSRKKRDIVNWLRNIGYNHMMTLRNIFVSFRAPSFRALIQIPLDDDQKEVENVDQVPKLFMELEGKTKRKLPKLELSGYPDYEDSNLGDYLFHDKNARKYLKTYDWFCEDFSTDEGSENGDSATGNPSQGNHQL